MFGKEYRHDGKTFHLAMPDAEYIRRLGCVEQRVKAHQLNGYKAGAYEEIAETWAIMLGITAEEATELPLRLFIEILKDCEAATEAAKKAAGG